ncbi:DUF2922 domain-containing protein [Clostridium fungisolvens]|uniref:DUF2922 domain-containing protein n=1 Tax=Clostridium fungisolvens TaxID=1604897 RepID=A0A6V8SNU4_9CLOT|nr:DUF2922 domain-containing protein [Clostridium fungisolvens]GFP76533.1 hypothetical protein bsdtw1_02636 [Clostridium fungisolvens]
METKTLVMTFKNEKGENINLSLRGIKDTLISTEISKAMDTIIVKNTFFSSGGNLVQKVGAQIVTKNIDEYKVG